MPYHTRHNPFSDHSHMAKNLLANQRSLTADFDKDAAWLDYATSPVAGENGDFKCYAERQLHRVDIAWLLISSMRVLSMQVAFGLFEAGCTRPCHVSTVVLKNVGDLLIGAIAYWLVGYGISFGNADDGVEGAIKEDTSTWTFSSGPFFQRVFLADVRADNAVWLFQMSFASTATTIVSGMIAERGTLRAYLILAFIITGVIYPVVVHWVWGGGLLAGLTGGQFTDFAGSSVVHMVGAFSGLAYCFAIGPRVGRFENVNMFAKARANQRASDRQRFGPSNHDNNASELASQSSMILNDNDSDTSIDNPVLTCLKDSILFVPKTMLRCANFWGKQCGLSNSTNNSMNDRDSAISSRKFSIFNYIPTETKDGPDNLTMQGHKVRRFIRSLCKAMGFKKSSEEGVSLRGMLLSKKMLELSRCMLKQRALDTAALKRGLVYPEVTNNTKFNEKPGSGPLNLDEIKINTNNSNNTNITPSTTTGINSTENPSNDTSNPNSNNTTKTNNSKEDINEFVIATANAAAAKKGPIELSELDRIIRGDPKNYNNLNSSSSDNNINNNVHSRAAVIWGVKQSGTTIGKQSAKMSGQLYNKGAEITSNSTDNNNNIAMTVTAVSDSERGNTKGISATIMNKTGPGSKRTNSKEQAKQNEAKKMEIIPVVTTGQKGSTTTVSTTDTKPKKTISSAVTGKGADNMEDEQSLTYNDQYGAELSIKRMLLRAGCFLDQRSGLPSIILFEKSKASSPVNMLFGTMLLLIGWFGFNCGSTTSLLNDADYVAARVGVNTMFAAIGGGTVPYFWYVLLLDDERPTLVQSVCMGILSGLVSSCAGVHLYDRWSAFMIGAIGWCAGEFCDRLLRNKFYIDDVVGGFAVHGAAGIWGTLAVALFANPDCTFTGEDWKPIGLFYGGDWEFLWWQFVGVIIIATWVFLSTYITLWLVDKFLVEIREDVISELLGAADAPKMVATLEVLCWAQLKDLRALKEEQTLALTNGTSSSSTSDDNHNKPQLEISKKVSMTSSIGSNLKNITGAGLSSKNKGPSDLLRLVEKSKLKFSQLNIEEQCILMRALNIRVNWVSGGMVDKDFLTSTVKQSAGTGNQIGENHSNSIGMAPDADFIPNDGGDMTSLGGGSSHNDDMSSHGAMQTTMSSFNNKGANRIYKSKRGAHNHNGNGVNSGGVISASETELNLDANQKSTPAVQANQLLQGFGGSGGPISRPSNNSNSNAAAAAVHVTGDITTSAEASEAEEQNQVVNGVIMEEEQTM